MVNVFPKQYTDLILYFMESYDTDSVEAPFETISVATSTMIIYWNVVVGSVYK